jgi:hypothetical protein
MNHLDKYDLTTHQGAEAFRIRAYSIVGVGESDLTNSLWGRAWAIGHEGGAEEILYCFWDLCEMEDL